MEFQYVLGYHTHRIEVVKANIFYGFPEWIFNFLEFNPHCIVDLTIVVLVPFVPLI